MDINHRCLEGGRVGPAGWKINRPRRVDTEAGLGYKNSCRSGGQEAQRKNKPLDNGGEIATIVITKTCSLKTK